MIGADEGGFAAGSLDEPARRAGPRRARRQPAGRWSRAGGISCCAARWPAGSTRRAGMNPADFAALRAALLNRDGRGRGGARAGAGRRYRRTTRRRSTQRRARRLSRHRRHPRHVPGGRGSRAALRKDPQWQMLARSAPPSRATAARPSASSSACSTTARRRAIDVLLAQRYAGAAGKARRAVTIEWDGVEEHDAVALGAGARASGVEPPAGADATMPAHATTIADARPRRCSACRSAPPRPTARPRAGVLSSAAMVDLYSQLFAADDIAGDWARRAPSAARGLCRARRRPRGSPRCSSCGATARRLQRYRARC